MRSTHDFLADPNQGEWTDLSVLHARAISDREGIIRALLQNKDPSTQEGDESDANFVLRKHTVQQSKQIVADKYNVLATIDVTSVDQLSSVVKEFIKGNENKDFGLLAPVCCARSHWCVLKLKVKHGRITRAKLWDPKGADVAALCSTPAYQNLQQIVSEINKDDVVTDVVTVEAVKAGVQPDADSHSCMDFGVQHILQKVEEDSVITVAKSAVELREAVIGEISENHPAVLQHFIYSVLTMPSNMETQIKFDEAMARKLQDLFDAPLTATYSKNQETGLFESARKQACELPEMAGLLKNFGVMAKPVVAANPGISAAAPKSVVPVAVK